MSISNRTEIIELTGEKKFVDRETNQGRKLNLRVHNIIILLFKCNDCICTASSIRIDCIMLSVACCAILIPESFCAYTHYNLWPS